MSDCAIIGQSNGIARNTFCQGLRDFVHKSRKRVRAINRS